MMSTDRPLFDVEIRLQIYSVSAYWKQTKQNNNGNKQAWGIYHNLEIATKYLV